MRAMSDDGSIPASPRIEAALTERFRDWGNRPVTIRFRRQGEILEGTLVMRWRIDHLEIDPDASEQAAAATTANPTTQRHPIAGSLADTVGAWGS